MGKEKNAYQYYCRTAEAETVYLVEKHRLEKICPELSTLAKRTENAPEKETPKNDSSSES
jgi:hypothetical protein